MKYIIYTYTGWESFTMKRYENFLLNKDINDISTLIFKDVYLTVNGRDGKQIKQNITSVLNGMTSAYKNTNNEDGVYVFKLDDPGLNFYSFIINNLTDAESLKKYDINNPNVFDNWDWPNDKEPQDIGSPESIFISGSYKLLNK